MSTMIATDPDATPKAEVTPDELLAMPDGGHYELIDGELRFTKPSEAEVHGLTKSDSSSPFPAS